ncbi:MAG TPA: hypothetical protein VK550_36065 [Polyangiaceae bacterium]|nr:hypothetical protein [Polyangiaceae bacterium]
MPNGFDRVAALLLSALACPEPPPVEEPKKQTAKPRRRVKKAKGKK